MSMIATAGVAANIQAAAPNVTSQLFGSGLIGLREGLEAAIVVTILVAFLVKADRRDALKWVWLGVGAAIAMTVVVFLAIQLSAYTITGLGAEAVAGIASLVAVAIVTTMVLWMRTAAAGLSGELRTGMARALETGGTEEQKQHWLPKLATGELLAAVALTEPDYGSDVANLKVTATPTEGGYHINGVKTWCTFAARADVLMLLARTDPDRRSDRTAALPRPVSCDRLGRSRHVRDPGSPR